MIAALRSFRPWRAGTGDEGQFQAASINKPLKPLLGALAQLGFRLAPGVACLRALKPTNRTCWRNPERAIVSPSMTRISVEETG
jgi:hypothetical protein